MKHRTFQTVLFLLLLTACSRAGEAKSQQPAKAAPHLAAKKNLVPDVNGKTVKLATVAVTPAVPKGEVDCRINSIDQFNDGIDYIVSPDGRSAAYVGCESDGSHFVFANGKLLRNLDEIWRPIYSRDGKHVAFFYRKNTVWTLSLDGRESVFKGQPAGFPGETMTFSPDGRFVYIEKMTQGNTLVIGGVRNGPYADVSLPVFSVDGKHVAYRAAEISSQNQLGTRTSGFISFDGVQGKKYMMATRPLLSPDGSTLSYLAVNSVDEKSQSAHCVLVIGKKEMPYACDQQTLMFMAYDQQIPVVFNKDGKHIAYPVPIAGKQGQEPQSGLIADGKRVTDAYDSMIPPAFNPVTGGLAYVAMSKDGGVSVVYQDRTSRSYTGGIGAPSSRLVTGSMGIPSPQGSLIFSPDGGKLIFIGKDASKGVNDNNTMLVVNGLESARYNEITSVAVSPDGKRIAFIAKRLVPGSGEPGLAAGTYFTSQYFAVIDGKEGVAYNSADFPVFSADSRHVAYVGSKGFKTVVVLDGKEVSNEYDAVIMPPVFTTTGQLAFGAKRGKDLWWVVKSVP